MLQPEELPNNNVLIDPGHHSSRTPVILPHGCPQRKIQRGNEVQKAIFQKRFCQKLNSSDSIPFKGLNLRQNLTKSLILLCLKRV